MSERRRIGPPPRMRPAPPARPVHAGGLAPWERLVFTVVVALMVAFVVIVTISSAHARQPAPATGTPAPAGVPASGSQADAATHGGEKALGTRARSAAEREIWNRRLATALAPVLARQTGQLAVGVVDKSTGAVAVYGGNLRFHTASIIKADILATLLLQREDSGVALTDADEDLATRMIEASDNDAATDLWHLVGTARGIAAANTRLGLRHTTLGAGNYWGLSSTTVGDQLRLLRDLTGHSALNAGSRAYELSLMQDVQADQRWGVPVAATPGTVYAVKNGWLPDGSARQWVINSIGVLEHDHQRLLIAVLSSGQPTEGTGIAQSQSAAQAAADCMTTHY